MHCPVSNQLSILRDYYGNPTGEHWDVVFSAQPKDSILKSLWRSIPDAIAALRGRVREGSDPAATVQNRIEAFFTDKLYSAVQDCLLDIEHHDLQPLAVIEPIDSPQSPLEGSSGLARSLITALLNVYRNSFEPSVDQRLVVKMSIPWHRYDVDELEYPQKLHQYTGRVFWRVRDLRQFINRRIEWEFARVKRPFSPKAGRDAWSVLMGQTITNKHCTERLKEDTFLYVLRHTHRRARDVLRVSRMAVEYAATRLSSPHGLDDILRSHGPPIIENSALRAAVKEYCRSTIDIRIAEAGRRFPGLRACVEQLFGLAVPFSTSDLDKRLKSMRDAYCGTANVSEALLRLWNAGLIGLEIYATDASKVESLQQRLGSGLRTYGADHQIKYRRWYVFEYNTRRENFTSTMQGYTNEDGIVVNLILHPMTFEYLTPVVARDCPKGA